MTDVQSPPTRTPDPATVAPPSTRVVWLRYAAITVWALTLAVLTVTRVMSFSFLWILLAVGLGLVATSIGRRNPLLVVRDWLPFALVLFAYDTTRGVAAFLGMPTRWNLAVDADRWMFGVVPTVWLQEHLKHADPQWWEVITSAVYMSYFVVPYVVAAWLWLRDRTSWRRFVTRFVALFLLGLVGYIVVPAAPPWAAAQCTRSQVADGPAFPNCLKVSAEGVPNGGLLGTVTPTEGGAPYVQRVSTRGWDVLHIGPVRKVVEVGQERSNQVAAIPSLHAGLTGLLAMFMWRRTRLLGRTLWIAYAGAMAFTLVYAAEHYVFDLMMGWSLAALVMLGCGVAERWWARRRAHSQISVDRVGENA